MQKREGFVMSSDFQPILDFVRPKTALPDHHVPRPAPA
jgi:hypothetical protein